jgi:acetyl-CoA carboxylase biotin carboxylase subunit
VSPFYDPVISKLIAWGETRDRAIERLRGALGAYTVLGITTNVAWLGAALDHPAFRSGDYDTGFCARFARELLPPPDPSLEEVALVAAAVAAYKRDHEEAEAFAARAGAAPGGSAWARLGRLGSLRGGLG